MRPDAEAQRWWVALASSADGSGRVRRRGTDTADDIDAGSRGDVDAGVGLRLALPGASGIIRADVATGLRHGGTRWSFVYEP